jgi:hypothetical protein
MGKKYEKLLDGRQEVGWGFVFPLGCFIMLDGENFS